MDVRPDAFGNALGQGVVDASLPTPTTGAGIRASAESAAASGPQYSFDDLTSPADYGLSGGAGVRLGVGDALASDSIASSDPERFRQENLARMMRMADEQSAAGSTGMPFRVEISGLPTTDEYNAAQVQHALEKGWDLRPTVLNARRLELQGLETGSGSGLASRFSGGLLGAVKAVATEPLLQLQDLGLAGASVAYNELFRSDGDALWLPELKSGIAEAYANGASHTRLLLQSNPLTGIGVVSHDLTTATMKGDWGTVAEMGGGLVGGLAVGKVVSKYGGYGLAFEDIGAAGPMASQMGAVKISLVTPNSGASVVS